MSISTSKNFLLCKNTYFNIQKHLILYAKTPHLQWILQLFKMPTFIIYIKKHILQYEKKNLLWYT